MREAPSLVIIEKLLKAEPRWWLTIRWQCMKRAAHVSDDTISYTTDMYETLNNSDALLIVTEWPEFRSPDFNEIGKGWTIKVIFDGEISLISGHESNWFDYYCIGIKQVIKGFTILWYAKRVLITGVSGFLGCICATALLRKVCAWWPWITLLPATLKTLNIFLNWAVWVLSSRCLQVHPCSGADRLYYAHFASPASPIDYLQNSNSNPQGFFTWHAQCFGPARVKRARAGCLNQRGVWRPPCASSNEEYWGT